LVNENGKNVKLHFTKRIASLKLTHYLTEAYKVCEHSLLDEA